MLRQFVSAHRDEILEQARKRVLERSGTPSDEDRTRGLPVFLDQLGDALRKSIVHEVLDHTEIQSSAHEHGHTLFHEGLTIDQVVHDYGDLCQIITGLACEQKVAVPPEEFQTLNLCLDDAIAGAVTAYSKDREGTTSGQETERLGVLAHEMKNILTTAVLAFQSIKKGNVAVAGSTSALLERSLMRMNNLIDHSLAEVRLDAGMHHIERVAVRDLMEEVEIGASLVAQTRGLQFVVTQVEPTVTVDADRQILSAAVANLLLNAFKFTEPGTTVKLRASTTKDRVLIEVEDECGGLPLEKSEKLLRPFTQQGHDRTGLGLGLSICVRAAQSMAGELHVRDLPGKGCVFTIDLPKAPPASLHVVRERTPSDGDGKSNGHRRE